MSDSDSEFDRLMARLREGNREALEEMCLRYGGHIRQAIRRKLHQRLRRQYDSVDFLQAVWASFIAVPPEEYKFESSEQLVMYLSRLASNKVVDALRNRLETAKNDINREATKPPGADSLAAPQATASQVAIADERWEQLLQGLTPNQRQVVELLHQGHTYEEIGARLNIHPKVIQRLIRKLAERIDP